MDGSIVWHACRVWVSLTSVHTSTDLTQFVEPPVCHIKMQASRLVPCPRTQHANVPTCFPHYPFCAQRQTGSCAYHFLKRTQMYKH